MAKKNLGFEKKSGTPVFFCEQEVFLKGKNCLEKTIPMLPAWSWGLHKSQSSGRKRDEHFVWKKKEKRQVEKGIHACGVFFWVVNVWFCKTMGSSDNSTVEEPICVASSLPDP